MAEPTGLEQRVRRAVEQRSDATIVETESIGPQEVRVTVDEQRDEGSQQVVYRVTLEPSMDGSDQLEWKIIGSVSESN